MAGPPIPPGFQVESRGNDFDPLGPLFAQGVEATNGYRTPQDTQRLRAEGYTPADNSGHLRGDKVDLVPGRSGWSLNQLAARARQRFGPDAKIEVHNGTHVDIELPGWGQAPGTPGSKYSGLPPLPDGFKLEQRGSLKGANLSAPTGQAHDGDTLRLTDGRNARLFGADAYELGQSGRRHDNSLEPLGTEARDFISSRVTPSTPVSPTGQSSYGRPVVTLGDGSEDPARGLIRNGLGLAEPDYLHGDPRFSSYMEAERQARLNRLGGHDTNAETPAQFRHKDGPWKGAEPGAYGQGADAVFGDEPTPFQGLRPEIADGYLAIWTDRNSKPDDLLAYAKANGFTISPSATRAAYKKRNDPKAQITTELSYENAPKLLTNVGDGAAGAAVRGFGDPINMLDELGGVADTLTTVPSFDGPRENVWNSDRRFGDILWNNIDQNRAILGYDDEAHPVARIGGQLVSGLAVPGASVEGVGARAAAKALESGASEFAADQVARRAIATRLGTVGAAEGGAAGAGAGEGGVEGRLPGAVVGAAGGAAIGVVAPPVIGAGASLAKRGVAAVGRVADALRAAPGRSRIQERIGEIAGNEAGSGQAWRSGQPQGARSRSAAMAVDEEGNELVGPVVHQPDGIDVSQLPPIPEGFVLDEPSLGRTPRMDEQASPEAIADAARTIQPEDVISSGPNRVESLEEARRANPGRLEDVQAPDEFSQLPVRTLTTKAGGRVRVRGPLDLTQSVRLMGGLKDDGGDLAHLGLTNEPRRMPFGSNEQFLGKLIDNETGVPLDEATHRLWEEGYFPEFKDRPTPADLVDRLHAESTGAQRYFHPDDLEEVAAFHSAQAEHGRVDKAASEGSPLAQERGLPATLEDQAANQPPATAYEDLPTMGGRIANIDLSKVETKQDISRLLNTTESRFGGFDAARRGAITHAETESLASELGMRADDLLKRRKGQALNAEQALQARRILAKSSDEVVALAAKARGGSEEELAAFQRAMIRHAAIQEQVTGATAEAGRALNQFKIAAKSSAHRERILKAAIDNMGGRDSLEDMAELILAAQRDPAHLNRFIVDAIKPKWKDKLVELWYNSLLSGPQTHAVNILSNTLTAGLQLPEHATAAAIGGTRALFAKARGSAVTDRVLMSEIGPRAVGLLEGAGEGLRAFRKTLRTGEVSDQVTKVESARQEAISGLKGKIIRVPTHLLSAEDEFFKATARRMEIAGLAVRKATAEGLKGGKLKARIAELTANPTDEMVERSMDYARYLTFQRPLGPAMRHVQAVVQNHPWLKLFVPFVRTPTNILKFAVERSPAAPLLKEVRADLKAGGARRDLAAARIGLGTGLGLLVAQWTADGTITGGGPADANAKRLMQADKWQPYSIKIGGTYYSYRRLDPLATTIGVVADAVNLQQHMTDRQREQVGALVVSAVMQNLENKVWLSTLSDLNEAIHEPARKGQAFIERLAGSVAVPALVAQTARTVDPVARETSSESSAQGILDAIRARIPGASKGLLPKRDMFGEEVRSEGGLGPDLASPIWTSTAKDDPVAREVLDSGATIGRIQNNVGGGKLPDKMFNEYQAIAGQLTRQYLERAISSPRWSDLNRRQRQMVIANETKKARADARGALFQTAK